MEYHELRTAFIEALKTTGSSQMVSLVNEIFQVCMNKEFFEEGELGANFNPDRFRQQGSGIPPQFEKTYWPTISSLFWSFVVNGIIVVYNTEIPDDAISIVIKI